MDKRLKESMDYIIVVFLSLGFEFSDIKECMKKAIYDFKETNARFNSHKLAKRVMYHLSQVEK